MRLPELFWLLNCYFSSCLGFIAKSNRNGLCCLTRSSLCIPISPSSIQSFVAVDIGDLSRQTTLIETVKKAGVQYFRLAQERWSEIRKKRIVKGNKDIFLVFAIQLSYI